MTLADGMADGGDGSWTSVSTLSAFQAERKLLCNIDGLELLLVRVGSDVVAMHNYCTHLGKSLQNGRVMAGQISCPFHGACFDLKTGSAVSGPAVLPLHLFPVRLEGDAILVDLTKKPANLMAGFMGRSLP